VRVAFELTGQDCGDLRDEIALLEDYLGNLGEPETEAHRRQRTVHERRLDLMRRLVAAVPPQPKEHKPGEPLHDIEVSMARHWIESLRGPLTSHRYNWQDRAKLASVLERLLDAAPRNGIDHIAPETARVESSCTKESP
jgi:hypothetical protein